MASSNISPLAPSRRGFLRGRVRDTKPARRPPWAVDEIAFIERCTRCDRCIDVCPTGILVRMDGGFPGVDFTRGECTFCTDCVKHCEPRALVRDDAQARPWVIVAEIGASCLAASSVECRVCGEACPAGAIRFRPQLGGVARPQLDAARCTGCGACVAPCPTRAIAMQATDNLPTERET